MKIQCPQCAQVIPDSNLDIHTGLGKCPSCKHIFDLKNALEEISKNEAVMALANTPPPNMRMVVEDNLSDRKIILPPEGLKGKTIFMGGFSIFWICFVTFWTWGASQASWGFAAFSIPFWLVGFYLLYSTLNMLVGSETLQLRNEGFTLLTDKLFYNRSKQYYYDEIQNVYYDETFSRDNKGNVTTTTMVSMDTHKGKVSFFEGISRAEGEWLSAFLKNEKRGIT